MWKTGPVSVSKDRMLDLESMSALAAYSYEVFWFSKIFIFESLGLDQALKDVCEIKSHIYTP